MCYPFSEALRARIRVLLGQGPAVTDSSLAKRPQSAIAALRGNGCTGCYGTKVCFDLQRLSVPMVRYGGRPGFPQCCCCNCFMQAVQGFSSPHELLADPANNGRPRRRLAIAGWCYGASPLHSSTRPESVSMQKAQWGRKQAEFPITTVHCRLRSCIGIVQVR